MRAGLLALARSAGRLSRRLGRGGGTSLPGNLLLRVAPGAPAELAADLEAGTALVSATNGKTTTTRMLGACLEHAGWRLVTNAAGANLMSGITTALLDAGDAELGLFEVDEATLPDAAEALAPRSITLMNLFRDQLDRYGELEALAARWRATVDALDPASTMVINVDDPGIAGLGADRPGSLTFGIEDVPVDRDLPHAADSTRCRECDSPLVYDAVTIAHMGRWRCPACGARRPAPDVRATSVVLDGMRGQALVIEGPEGARIEADLGLAGLHNAYNATAAAAAALSLGVPADVIGPALSGRAAAFGRGEVVPLAGRELVLLLAKNPAGANENVHTLLLEHDALDLLILLNDRAADGRDISWIWDVDYELLVPRIRTLTVAGDRAWDLALRFRYSGLAEDRMAVASASQALDVAIERTPEGGRLYVLPTYTALLELRARLRRRGLVEAFWQDG